LAVSVVGELARKAEWASSGVCGEEVELVSCVELVSRAELHPDGVREWSRVDEASDSEGTVCVLAIYVAALVVGNDSCDAESSGADDELGEKSLAMCGDVHVSSRVRRQGSSTPDPGPSNDLDRRRSASLARSESVRWTPRCERVRVGDAAATGCCCCCWPDTLVGLRFLGVGGELRPIESNEPKSNEMSRSGSCNRCSEADDLTGDTVAGDSEGDWDHSSRGDSCGESINGRAVADDPAEPSDTAGLTAF
jgi:hypothetical protein